MKNLNIRIRHILIRTTKSVRKIKMSHQQLVNNIMTNKLIITEDGIGKNKHNNN